MGIIKYIIIYFFILTACNDPISSNVNTAKSQSCTGVVIAKYIDIEDHGAPLLILNSDKQIYLGLIPYNFIKIGDSINKKKNTFHVEIYRNNSLKDVIFLNEENSYMNLDTNEFNSKYWNRRHLRKY